MNKRINISMFLHTVILLFLSLLFFSCDTEYIDKINTIPGDVIKVPGYTQIESFTLKDTENNTISAALTDNTIIVTWSSHIAIPETIKPEIILGTEATISPASGAEVPFKDGTVYTVNSKAGTTKQYTLKIDFRQQEPSAWTLAGGETYRKGLIQKKTNPARGGTYAIDNLWLSFENTRVYFVSATDETEYTAEIIYMGSPTVTPYTEYGIYYFLPENMPVGMYDLRIKNGAYTLQNTNVDNQYKISVIEPDTFNTANYGFPVTKQTGETLEVRGGMMNTVTSVELYLNSNATVTYPVEIVSTTSYRAVLKIPAGIPAGTYDRMRFKRGAATSNFAYTVTIK